MTAPAGKKKPSRPKASKKGAQPLSEKGSRATRRALRREGREPILPDMKEGAPQDRSGLLLRRPPSTGMSNSRGVKLRPKS